MAAPTQMLDQVDVPADSMMESIREVQTTMSTLHSTVSVLINSVTEMLKAMTEMKTAVQSMTPVPVTYSRVTAEQDIPATGMDKSIDEKKESRYANLKKIEVEMPEFDGHDVHLWIARAERYFKIGNFTDREKIQLVYMSVDKAALSWFNLWEYRPPFVDWNDLKTRLLERFGDTKLGCPITRLLNLKQGESVEEYLSQFEEIASQLPPDSSRDEFYKLVFSKGLREEIQKMLRMFQPKSLEDVISMARTLEDTCFCRLVKKELECSSPTDDE